MTEFHKDARARIEELVHELMELGIHDYPQILATALTPAMMILQECGTPSDLIGNIHACRELTALHLLLHAYGKEEWKSQKEERGSTNDR